MVPSSRHGHWAVVRLWPLAGPTGWKPRSESADLVRADLRWLPLALSTVGSEGQRSPQHCRAGALGEAESEEEAAVRADCHFLQDSYPRFLKSDMYKVLLEEAVIPSETKRR